MSTFYQAAKFSQRSKQLAKLGALSRRLTPGASASLSRNASGAISKKRCAASLEDEGESHLADQGKTSRRSVSNFAAAIPIALVGLLPFGRNKGRGSALDNADDSFVDFLEEDGGYHHEYFHSGVAEKLANYGISDD
jgi:hypothetical protein